MTLTCTARKRRMRAEPLHSSPIIYISLIHIVATQPNTANPPKPPHLPTAMIPGFAAPVDVAAPDADVAELVPPLPGKDARDAEEAELVGKVAVVGEIKVPDTVGSLFDDSTGPVRVAVLLIDPGMVSRTVSVCIVYTPESLDRTGVGWAVEKPGGGSGGEVWIV